MDRQTAEHFYLWLTEHVIEEEQHEVEHGIHRLLRAHPTLIAEGRSWPEMRHLAEQTL